MVMATEQQRRMVRDVAEQIRRNADDPDFDPRTAVAQLRGTADLVEAEMSDRESAAGEVSRG